MTNPSIEMVINY